ncbi:MAG: hypothetical protein ACOYMF_01340 [Bacteroidales bacterium]
MNSIKLSLRIAGTIFGVVALIHLLRLITGVEILIGGFSLPMWINWMGLIGTTFLCLWLWRLSEFNND